MVMWKKLCMLYVGLYVGSWLASAGCRLGDHCADSRVSQWLDCQDHRPTPEEVLVRQLDNRSDFESGVSETGWIETFEWIEINLVRDLYIQIIFTGLQSVLKNWPIFGDVNTTCCDWQQLCSINFWRNDQTSIILLVKSHFWILVFCS